MESTNESLLKRKKSESKIPLFLFFLTSILKLSAIIYFLITKFNKKVTKFIDLHLHLDGAITVDIAKKLSKLQNIPLEAKTDEEMESIIKDLTAPEVFNRQKTEMFLGEERVACSTNIDPTGKKLEITTDRSVAIHLTR